jgi:hypothetical protein
VLLPPFGAGSSGEPVYAAVRTELFGPRRNLISARNAEGRKVVLSLDEADELVEVLGFDLAADPEGLQPLEVEDWPAADRAAYEALIEGALAWYRDTAAARPPEPLPMDGALRAAWEEALREVGYTADR